MTDPQLLLRLDAIIALLALAIVVAIFGLMAIDVAVGVLAFAAVVLTGAVGLRSYRRELRRAAADDHAD